MRQLRLGASSITPQLDPGWSTLAGLSPQTGGWTMTFGSRTIRSGLNTVLGADDAALAPPVCRLGFMRILTILDTGAGAGAGAGAGG